jgi:hypothetical protein
MIWHQNCFVKDPFVTVGCRRPPYRAGARPEKYEGWIAAGK